MWVTIVRRVDLGVVLHPFDIREIDTGNNYPSSISSLVSDLKLVVGSYSTVGEIRLGLIFLDNNAPIIS